MIFRLKQGGRVYEIEAPEGTRVRADGPGAPTLIIPGPAPGCPGAVVPVISVLTAAENRLFGLALSVRPVARSGRPSEVAPAVRPRGA
jgi:hypothetical protein